MDPTFDDGEHTPVTEHGLTALDRMGYKIARDGGGDPAPVILTLSASLEGDVLTLPVTASDPQGDITQAQVKLLDGAGTLVAQMAPFAVNVGTWAEVSFLLTVTNLMSFPTVVQASLTLTDSSLSGPLQIEINGRIVASGASGSNKKVLVKGSATSLNLRGGPNRVRVRNGGLWSNIYIAGA